MTNEEIVLKIQAGENRYEELWEQVKRFVYQKAFSYSLYFPGSTIEVDDLAQGAFLALVKAVKTYDPEAGAGFLTWLNIHIRKAWRTMYGLSGKPDALDNSISLDEEIDEEGDTTRLDLLPDDRAELAFEESDERTFVSELRALLEKALDAAPHGDIVRRRYFQGQTQKEIAKESNVSFQAIHNREQSAMRYLRSGPFTQRLLDFDYYHGTGLQAWKDSGCSVEERILLQKELWWHGQPSEKTELNIEEKIRLYREERRQWWAAHGVDYDELKRNPA